MTDEWALTVPDSMTKHFKEITTALKSWTPEILAYFTHPYTNAYTEALNGVTKVINRQGRGYTFEVLRARVLFKDYQLPQPPVAAVEEQLVDFRSFMVEEARHTCSSCGGVFTGLEVELHHITPPQEGGQDTADNLLVMCKSCNRRLAHQA